MTNYKEQIVGIAISKRLQGRPIEARYKSLESLCDYSLYKSILTQENLKDAERTLEILDKMGVTFIPYTSNLFPNALRSEPSAIAGLYVKTNQPLNGLFCYKENSLTWAVIGTRDISVYGKYATIHVVNKIKEEGANDVIVSGLSLGVGAVAHKTAIECGLKTIAVVATGLDTVYPFANKSLAEDIIENGGALISQFAPGTAPAAINFLMRNAEIAKLSHKIVVTESKLRGGAIVTARHAYDFSKPVLAVPGRVDDMRSVGCNWLIAQGIANIWNK